MICLLCEDDLDDDIITELLAINFSLFVDLFDASFLTPRDKFVNESLRLVSDLNVTCCSHGCLYCATHVSLLWQQSYPICCFSPFGFIRAIIAPPCVNNNPFQPSLTFSSFFSFVFHREALAVFSVYFHALTVANKKRQIFSTSRRFVFSDDFSKNLSLVTGDADFFFKNRFSLFVSLTTRRWLKSIRYSNSRIILCSHSHYFIVQSHRMITQSRCFSPLNVNSRVRKLHESSPSFKNLRIVKKYKKMCALSCVCKVLLISLPALTFIYRPRRALSEPKYVRSASLGAPRRSKVAPSSSIRLRRWGRTRIAYITIFILAVSREKEGPNTRHRASIYYWARRESRGESLSKSITQIVRRQLLSKLTYECLRERKTSGLVDIVLNEGFSSLELFFFFILETMNLLHRCWNGKSYDGYFENLREWLLRVARERGIVKIGPIFRD